MIPLNLWEHHNAIKALYANCVGEVCQKHGVTRMELDILLFLANNPCYDTAKDIVEIRYLSKSQVSISIALLEKGGYLAKKYQKENRKTAHLMLCSKADPLVSEGRRAQERFLGIMVQGISEEDITGMKRCMAQIMENIHYHLKEVK